MSLDDASSVNRWAGIEVDGFSQDADGWVMRELIRIVQGHMDEYGVSEAEVARRIGAQPQTVNTWRNGEMKQLPKHAYLTALATLTGRRYADVLSAALMDTSYLEKPIGYANDYAPLLASLAVDAEDLQDTGRNLDTMIMTNIDVDDTDEVESLVTEVETLISDVDTLVSDINEYVDVVNDLATKVLGQSRLQRMKQDTRRFRRRKYMQQYGTGFLDDPDDERRVSRPPTAEGEPGSVSPAPTKADESNAAARDALKGTVPEQSVDPRREAHP